MGKLHRHYCAFLSAAVLFTSLARAEEKKAELPPLPTVTNEKGQPYVMTWPDGREARLRVAVVDSPDMKSRFKVVDSDCSDYQGMTCTYNFRFRRFFTALVWTKNPVNPERVGKTVKTAYFTEGNTSSQLLRCGFR